MFNKLTQKHNVRSLILNVLNVSNKVNTLNSKHIK